MWYNKKSMGIQDFELSYNFSDIAIDQNYNDLDSRLLVDISSEIIRGVHVKVPLIASNMSTVINKEFYEHLLRWGAFAFMHRAMPKQEMIETAKYLKDRTTWVAMSIGIGEDSFELARDLIKAGANILLVDVAHGYSKGVLELAKKLKETFGVKIVLGNTTNVEMLYAVNDYCDALKVGIAQGFACETKNTAGCTLGQFSAVYRFKEAAKQMGMPIISDGGIREPADFTKAIAAGANSVMAGSIFARCPESAAETVWVVDKQKKLYAGMASRYVQEQWHGRVSNDCPEGKVTFLDLGESAINLINRYAGALRSGITYGGGDSIESFQRKVKFVRFK